MTPSWQLPACVHWNEHLNDRKQTVKFTCPKWMINNTHFSCSMQRHGSKFNTHLMQFSGEKKCFTFNEWNKRAHNFRCTVNWQLKFIAVEKLNSVLFSDVAVFFRKFICEFQCLTLSIFITNGSLEVVCVNAHLIESISKWIVQQ